MRCYLRNLDEKDLETRMHWINSPWIYEHTGFAHPVTLHQMKAWFERTKEDDKRIDHVICDAASDALIGMIGLLGIHQTHRHAELYVSIGNEEFAGKNVGKEAIALMLREAFLEMKLHKVFLHTFAFNTRAVKLYEKCGFSLEGCFRDHVYKNGAFQDVMHFGLLKEEWEKVGQHEKYIDH